MKNKVLVINPGSTSTKIAIFEDEKNLVTHNFTHSTEELKQFDKISDQFEYRKNIIVKWLESENYKVTDFEAVVGRGGLLRPMPSGTYKVTEKIKHDMIIGYQGQHASNLGGLISDAIAKESGVDAYIVDPVSVDEIDDICRISGIPQIERLSLSHALNIRATAYRVANELGRDFNEMNMIVAHIGGGISINPIQKGRMIDTNNANAMGPFSPERTGTLPAGDLAKLCFSGKFTHGEMKKKILRQGGLTDYLGTNDIRKVEEMISNNDEKAKLVLEALSYQVAKEIGACACSLKGNVDVIVITGGAAHSEFITNYVEDMVSYIAPIKVEPGEDELMALNQGYLRVKNGKEKVKIYEEEVSYDK
ncbi:MAG: butyrate kinase [Clostridiales bacterium]|nr:MAG: butyrate kinase [Clostridiales bacterium]